MVCPNTLSRLALGDRRFAEGRGEMLSMLSVSGSPSAVALRADSAPSKRGT